MHAHLYMYTCVCVWVCFINLSMHIYLLLCIYAFMFLCILNQLLPLFSSACDQLPQQLRIIDLYTETAHEGDDVVVHHASDTE